jgi:hypothetical protein
VTTLIFDPHQTGSDALLSFETGAGQTYRLVDMAGLDPVPSDPISTKAPGQAGETALDRTVPPRIVTAKAMITTDDAAAMWTARRAISVAFASQPVRIGESLTPGILTLVRDGFDVLEIEAIPRSAEVVKAPNSRVLALLQAEWVCPSPYWRAAQDSVMELSASGSAISATSLTAGSSSTDATSYETAAVDFVAGRLYILAITNSKATTPDAIYYARGSVCPDLGPGGSDPDGAWTNCPVRPWTSIATVLFDAIATPTKRLTVLRMIPLVNFTDSMVIDFGAGNTQTGAAWSITEFVGTGYLQDDAGQGVVQSATNRTDSGTSATATLAAFADADNATFAATAKASTGGFTPGAGFAELSDVNAATPAQALEAEFKATNDTTADQSWAGATAAAIIALEIRRVTSVPYAGDVDAPILAQLWGPATLVRLTNVTTGEAFEVAVTLLSTDYLEVDTTQGAKAIEKVDALTETRTNLMSGLNLAVADLWQLTPGSSNELLYDVTGGSSASHARVTWRTRYAGV